MGGWWEGGFLGRAEGHGRCLVRSWLHSAGAPSSVICIRPSMRRWRLKFRIGEGGGGGSGGGGGGVGESG